MIICAGATGSGKTELAAALALRLAGELVSADSRQVYKGFDAGTNKSRPSGVTTHLLDVAEPDEPYSVGRFLEDAAPLILEIRSRRRVPIVVGGTGLYIKALTEGLSDLPQRDEAVRAELQARLEKDGIAALRKALEAIDPSAAQTIPEGNTQRLIRALEVHALTGKPISEAWARRYGAVPGPWRAFVIEWPPEQLKQRLLSRCAAMWPSLIEEVRLLRRRYSGEEPAFESLGYREALDFVEGRRLETEAYAAFEKATLSYAKRQRTWFRNQLEAEIIRGATVEDMTEQALRALGRAGT